MQEEASLKGLAVEFKDTTAKGNPDRRIPGRILSAYWQSDNKILALIRSFISDGNL